MSAPYIGEIRQFAGNFAPANWALCNGAILSIASNDVLFNLIGTTYGGDGVNTFALPNLQSRVPIHQGSHLGTTYVIGQSGGTETVTLTTNQMPVHTHIPLSSATGSSSTPASNLWATTNNASQIYGAAPGSVALNTKTVSIVGGSQSHDNTIPYLAITYIIALYGIYPSQG